jgi:hypothetical protein
MLLNHSLLDRHDGLPRQLDVGSLETSKHLLTSLEQRRQLSHSPRNDYAVYDRDIICIDSLLVAFRINSDGNAIGHVDSWQMIGYAFDSVEKVCHRFAEEACLEA